MLEYVFHTFGGGPREGVHMLSKTGDLENVDLSKDGQAYIETENRHVMDFMRARGGTAVARSLTSRKAIFRARVASWRISHFNSDVPSSTIPRPARSLATPRPHDCGPRLSCTVDSSGSDKRVTPFLCASRQVEQGL